MQAPVVGVAATFDVATVLELVDVGDDPARQQAQLSAERLLTAAGIDAIARRMPACGGVRSIDAISSANTAAEWWPSWDNKKATLSPSACGCVTAKSYQ